MKLTGKKARKLRKKRANIVRLQEVLEDSSQQEELQNWSFAEISEQRHRVLRHGEAI
jgi:endonuclease/exonuclease/phosphatase family metal-dependent hydrolase